MKLLIDMNLSPEWVTFLQAHGYESKHWASVGLANAGDPEIMRHAHEHGFAVLTNDLDFGIMLALSAMAKPSVIQIRSDEVLPGQIGAIVIRALHELYAQIEAGALVTIHPKRTRITLLPLS